MRTLLLIAALVVLEIPSQPTRAADPPSAAQIFQSVASHRFHPLNNDGSFTNDRQSDKQGIANLGDEDWRTRLLAIRDLLLAFPDHAQQVRRGLKHENIHVRQFTAAALGIHRDEESIAALAQLLESDPSALVRSQAAMSLGQLEATEAVGLVQEGFESDSSRDVRHQCELALDQIANNAGATQEQLEAFNNLDEEQFERLAMGETAPAFSLSNAMTATVAV